MGICCSIRRMDNSLQHGLNVNDDSDQDDTNNDDNILMHENQIQQEIQQTQPDNDTPSNLLINTDTDLNTMSVTISHFTDHPIQNNEEHDDDDDDDSNELWDQIQEEQDEDAKQEMFENDDDEDDDKDNDDENSENNRYRKLLKKMKNRKLHKRKNLKSFLTQIKKTKEKQLITKKKKLKQLLLDRNNEKEYNTAFEPHITPNAPKFKKISSRSTFPEISFTEWIIKQGVELNDIINEVFNTPPSYQSDDDDEDEENEDMDDDKEETKDNANDNDNNVNKNSDETSSNSSESSPASAESSTCCNNKYGHLYVGYIPEEISVTITMYTLDLLPGIYEFVGTMDYNGTDDDDDYGSSWGIYGYGGGNHCTCQIILNSRAEIIGGHFSENSFKYHITNGTYTYDKPYCIEFTKEYFNYNYKYKVYGQIDRSLDENLQFKGYWKLLNGSRGGNVKMRYIETDKGCKKNQKLQHGKYQFYGHCDYLPNTARREFFDDRQRIKCYLTLNEKDYRIKGYVKLLKGTGYSGFYRRSAISSIWLDNDDNITNDTPSSDSDDDDDKNIFIIDEKESEWDIYGGLHIQLINQYVMEGFFNGEDFMGVWKDDQFKRFGHFHYETFTPANDDKNSKTKQGYDNNDGDDDDDDDNVDQHDEEEKNDVLMSSSYYLTRAKSLDSEEDIHEQNREEDID